MGEVEAHVRAGQGLFEPLAGDGVDAAVGRGGDSLVAALAQNGNGLRADQAGAADDDDLHGLPSLVDDWRPLNANTSEKKSAPQRACIIASVRNTPLAVPLATERNPSKRGCRGICSLAKCSGNQVQCCDYSTASSRFGDADVSEWDGPAVLQPCQREPNWRRAPKTKENANV